MKLRYYIRGLGIGIAVTAVIMSGISHSDTKTLSDEQIIARAKQLGMEEKKENPDQKDETASIKTDAGVSTTIMQENENENNDKNSQSANEGEDNKQSQIAEDGTNKDTVAKSNETLASETTGINQNQITIEGGKNTGTDETENNDAGSNSENVKPSEDTNPAAETKPADETNPAAETKPADETNPAAEIAPADETNPAAETKPAEDTKPDREVQPTEILETITVTVNSGDGSEVVAKKMQQAGLIEDAKAYDKFLCKYGYDRRLCTGNHVFTKGDSDEQMAKELMTRLN